MSLEAMEFRLPRTADATGLARTLVDRHLRPHLSDNASGNVKMVVSELVTNAIAHGDGDIVLRTELREDAVRIEVVDQGSGRFRADGGWGLRIVDALAARWGAHEGSTHVWADVPVR